MTIFGEAISILARSTWAPSANLPERIPTNKSKVLFHGAIPVGTLYARFGESTTIVADLIGAQTADICLTQFNKLTAN